MPVKTAVYQVSAFWWTYKLQPTRSQSEGKGEGRPVIGYRSTHTGAKG